MSALDGISSSDRILYIGKGTNFKSRIYLHVLSIIRVARSWYLAYIFACYCDSWCNRKIMNRRIILPWSLILQIKVHYGEILFRYIFKKVMNHTGIQDSCSVFIFLRLNIFFCNISCLSEKLFLFLVMFSNVFRNNSTAIYIQIFNVYQQFSLFNFYIFLISWLSF